MARLASVSIRLTQFAACILLMQLFIAILHQILLLSVAAILSSIDIHSVNTQLDQLPLDVDAVHSHLALSVITSVSPRGLAVAGLPGEWLHTLWPAFFLDPTLALPGTWISAILARGSSLPGLFSTRLLSEILLVVFGAMLVRSSLIPRVGGYLVRHPRLSLSHLTALGLYMEAQGVWGMLRLTPSAAELERLGLGLLVRNLLSTIAVEHPWFAYTVFPQIIMLLLISFALGLVPALEYLGPALKRIVDRFRRVGIAQPEHLNTLNLSTTRHVLTGFVLLFALAGLWPRTLNAKSNLARLPTSNPGHWEARVRPLPTMAPSAVPVQAIQLATPTVVAIPTADPTLTPAGATATLTPTAIPTRSPIWSERTVAEPSLVRIHWSPALEHFVLTDRNGELFTLRAINYNTHYTMLPLPEQLRILRRDFAKMQQAGANAITGYGTFDETTLQVAQEYGIYVVMPFVPDLKGDYLDAEYREQVKRDLVAFISRYENYTSLLMWNFDDEPVHNMIERFHRPPDQVQAFSDFLVEMAEYAYRTDRYHRPTWLKEPRDWYLDIFGKSIERARRASGSTPSGTAMDPSVYVIAARSAYGAPLDVQEWLPKLSHQVEIDLRMPFAVGEYGVLGVDPKERADHLVEIWQDTQRASRIGSGVYTFGPFQPDPNDLTDPAIAAQLQLVDQEGLPVDNAWARLSGAWLSQQEDERAGRMHPSIPLAVPDFSTALAHYGGWPSSGPIQDGTLTTQHFVQGTNEGRVIGFALTWNPAKQNVDFAEVGGVVFSELGDYTLSGTFLKEYLANGGYARYGAPVSNTRTIWREGEQVTAQDFAKGWTIFQRMGIGSP